MSREKAVVVVRGELQESGSYCLGYGSHNKCDGCQQEKRWQMLNQLPETLRLSIQNNMKSIDSWSCVLNDRPHYESSDPSVVKK